MVRWSDGTVGSVRSGCGLVMVFTPSRVRAPAPIGCSRLSRPGAQKQNRIFLDGSPRLSWGDRRYLYLVIPLCVCLGARVLYGPVQRVACTVLFEFSRTEVRTAASRRARTCAGRAARAARCRWPVRLTPTRSRPVIGRCACSRRPRATYQAAAGQKAGWPAWRGRSLRARAVPKC